MRLNLPVILIAAMLAIISWQIRGLEDATAMYQKGLIKGRCEAHDFIRARFGEEWSGKYCQWLGGRSR